MLASALLRAAAGRTKHALAEHGSARDGTRPVDVAADKLLCHAELAAVPRQADADVRRERIEDRAPVPIPAIGARECKDYSDTHRPVSANSVTEQGERNLLWPLQSAAAGEKIGVAEMENET